jgi:transmembrane sensor
VYESFSSQDFLEDEHFIDWIKYRTPELEQFWSEWILTRPANLEAFKEAEKQLTLILSVERIEAEKGDEESVLDKIRNSIDATPKVIPLRTGVRRLIIAASVAAVLLLTAGIWFVTYQRDTEFSTAYGEMKKISLPDQTEITLNANSHVSFRKNWNRQKAREVWLEGEAYFNVKHLNKNPGAIKENERFIIHTKFVEVEVLGTVFNVKERRGKTEVSLESGSVKVQLNNEKSKQWYLKPREVVVYNNSKKELNKFTEDPEIHKAWTERKMLTNNTTVGEIIQTLEDQYGHKVILEDPELAKRRIDGTLPFTSESNVLFVLSNILEIDIEKNDSTVIFKSRK